MTISMNPNDDLNSLGYTSSAPDFDFAPKDTVKPQDEEDAPTLRRIIKLLDSRKAYYASKASLALGRRNLTIEHQLILDNEHLLLIQELESMIRGTLTKVQEKQIYGR